MTLEEDPEDGDLMVRVNTKRKGIERKGGQDLGDEVD